MVFDCAFGNVKPKFPPVAPFIAGAGNQLHDFHRSLAGLRRKCARSKLCNLMSNFHFLPMQTIMLREDFDRGLPVVQSRRPDILCQGHHGIRCQLVDLDLESTQDLRHESMRRQTKASGEKASKTTNSPYSSGTSSAPGTRATPPPKYPSCCMSCTRIEDIRDAPNSTVSPGCNSSAATLLSVSSDDAPAGGVSAAEEEEDGMATYHRRRRAVCFTRARSPTSRSKEGRRAAKRFQKEARVLWRIERVSNPRRPAPFYTQDATLRETRNPTVPRPSTVTSKTPAEPLRARAASPPSSDAFGTR
jgi:hypothetical protein